MKYRIHFLWALVLGNIATSLWCFPFASKLLHKIRGVKFADSKSVFIGRDVIIDNRYPEHIYIGADVWITARCVILSHSFVSESQRAVFGKVEQVGRVVIEDGVFIGASSVICPNVTISKNSYIAAGSVVVKDVPPGVLVGGNPAKIIKKF